MKIGSKVNLKREQILDKANKKVKDSIVDYNNISRSFLRYRGGVVQDLEYHYEDNKLYALVSTSALVCDEWLNVEDLEEV
mgnify:CR=1 FL=1